MSLADLLRRRATDPAHAERTFLRFEDEQVSFAETQRRAARWAHFFLAAHDSARPFHVGLLLENRPEFVYAELGAAMAGAVIVGLNPTRRGEHLAADVAVSDCQLVVSEARFAPALGEALAGATAAAVRVVDVDGDAPALLATQSDVDPEVPVGFDDLFLLTFTSGTTGGPKAVMRGHGRLALMAEGAAGVLTQATADDVVYCAMPLFHSNAQILALGMSLAAGCGLALARRFSKTRFLDDVRRHGATLFNYVGSPLAYVMDTPPRPDDADNPLRLAYGNEGPRQYLDTFARRFGCRVIDSYGASECGVTFTRHDGDPPGSLGQVGGGVAILNEHGEECAAARLDAAGRVLNPDDAIGEIVNTGGVGLFEGYYKNHAATDERRRGGRYHTGDLGYRDEHGYVYFAGRDVEWLRVDGENFLARPVEGILQRHPDVFLAAVYAVPDAEAGDRVMAALVLRDGAHLDGRAIAHWLDAQGDLSPKWHPTYVRVVPDLERSETNKVQKRMLQREKFLVVGPGETLHWRPRGADAYRPFTADDLAELRDRFARAGNLGRFET
jgi:fatty-acyl-CoA synthase